MLQELRVVIKEKAAMKEELRPPLEGLQLAAATLDHACGQRLPIKDDIYKLYGYTEVFFMHSPCIGHMHDTNEQLPPCRQDFYDYCTHLATLHPVIQLTSQSGQYVVIAEKLSTFLSRRVSKHACDNDKKARLKALVEAIDVCIEKVSCMPVGNCRFAVQPHADHLHYGGILSCSYQCGILSCFAESGACKFAGHLCGVPTHMRQGSSYSASCEHNGAGASMMVPRFIATIAHSMIC